MEMIEFTPEKARKLRKAFEEAVEDEAEVFYFEGHELVIGYAKYLLEYLEERYEEKKD